MNKFITFILSLFYLVEIQPTQISSCIEITFLQFNKLTGFRVRRAIKKQNGGSVSVPVSRTNTKIRASIKEMIENGSYNVGVPVVETEISKLAISNEGEVIQKKIDVQARKIPFQDIRKEALMRNKNLLKIKDDDYYDQLTEDELTYRASKNS